MPVSYLSEKSELPKSDYYGSYVAMSRVLPVLSYNIQGRPMIVTVTCKRLSDAQELKRSYGTKDDVEIFVLVSEALFEKLSLLYPAEVKKITKWDVFMSMVEDRRLHFEKRCASILYNAIDNKSREGFEQALNLLQSKFTPYHKITKDDIAKLFYVQDVVFPRQVLIAFLTLRRDRWRLLKQCEMNFPSSLVYYAMRENLDKLIESKGKYYETGRKDYLSAQISANNLAAMKQVFLSPIRDPYVILNFYEKGGVRSDSC